MRESCGRPGKKINKFPGFSKKNNYLFYLFFELIYLISGIRLYEASAPISIYIYIYIYIYTYIYIYIYIYGRATGSDTAISKESDVRKTSGKRGYKVSGKRGYKVSGKRGTR